MAFHREQDYRHWAVAYLPIDPRDLGRRYEEVVRINSQSGKGGVALVLERDHGITLPKWLHPAISRVVQSEADASGEEISSRQILALFQSEFLAVPEGWRLQGYDLHSEAQRTHGTFPPRLGRRRVDVERRRPGADRSAGRRGEPAIRRSVAVVDFDEHAMTPGRKRRLLLRSPSRRVGVVRQRAASTKTLRWRRCKRRCRRWAAHSPSGRQTRSNDFATLAEPAGREPRLPPRCATPPSAAAHYSGASTEKAANRRENDSL